MKTNRRENLVQIGVTQYLDTRTDLFWWRQNTGAARFGGSYIKFGLPGASDILGVQAPYGRMVGIEVKREKGGVVSEAQKRWGQNLINHGGIWVVAECVEDVEKALGPQLARVVKLVKQRAYAR